VRGISIVAWPLENGAPKPNWKPGTDTIADIRPGSFLKLPILTCLASSSVSSPETRGTTSGTKGV
jgi:hypothetical protein